jgi:hypothetical protein
MKKIIFIILLQVLNINNSSAQHLKKDGTPDRRYKENRIQPNTNNTIITTIPQSNYSNPVNTNAIDTNKNTNVNTYVQCSGMTKKGTRCKRMTNSISGRCYQH